MGTVGFSSVTPVDCIATERPFLMTADITQLPNGAWEALYANTPAWHRLGETFAPGQRVGMTTTDVERLCPSVFAERSLIPFYGSMTGPLDLADPFTMIDPATLIDSADFRMIVRQDTRKVHGVAKKGYRVWQVREAFAFLDSLVSDGTLEYESVFSLKGGDHVVLVCRLPGAFSLGSDLTLTYVMVKVSFTGSDAIVMVPTCVRVVCANTVALAVSQAKGKSKGGKPITFRLRHTGGLDDRLADARTHLAQFDSALAAKAKVADTLAGWTPNRTQAESFIADMFPLPTDEKGTVLQKGRKVTERERKVTIMRASWKVELNTLKGMGETDLVGTGWHLLQSLTRAVDHGAPFSWQGEQVHQAIERRKGSNRARDESDFLSTIEGSGAILKARGEASLLALAGA